MQTALRSILLIILILLLCYATESLDTGKKEQVLNDWETIQTEQFLNRLCRNGICSFDEYLRFYQSLLPGKNMLEIRIEEYKREQDLGNSAYYSLVSWEDIKDIILTDGKYWFTEESIILIEVQQTGRTGKKTNRRFGWVMEE